MDANRVAEKVDEWLAWDRNEKTRAEIEALLRAGKQEELARVLTQRMSFGTAGLRGRMGAGYACMNDLVIVQTAQGFLDYLVDTNKNTLQKNGIVIGYDGRHKSKRFAQLTAAVFLHAQYPVRLFSNLVPTPFVPFAVSKWGCAAGVMVTASHNPKEDNGYKVYNWNGAQIVSPVDKEIQQRILNNLKPLDSSWDTSVVTATNKLLTDPLDETIEDYMSMIKESVMGEHRAMNATSDLKFAYTAMHGVGYEYIVKALKSIGLEVVPVKEQIEPDPDFPTVKFPNPEEGKSSLDLSIKTADANGCDVILANDPDADRLAVAEKISGNWRVFTGNELGALLGWWMIDCYKKTKPAEKNNDGYVLSSAVSSRVLQTIATAENLKFKETLTGFKWIGNEAYNLKNNNQDVVFAFEEAIGFMCGSGVLDKDGVSAAAQFATMAVQLRHKNLTLSEKLVEIYKKHGVHINKNSYYICHDPVIINNIFSKIRGRSPTESGDCVFPKSILDGKYKIVDVRDLTAGIDTREVDRKPTLPVSKSSQMITFYFDNNFSATLRTSGTEPKIKYYTELIAPPGMSEVELQECQRTATEMVDALLKELLEPEKNKLIPQCS